MNKINALYVSLVALVVAIIALVMCIVCCNRGGKAGSSADVEKILADKPELIANALQLAEQKRIEAAMAKIESETGHIASDEELAAELEITIDELADWQGKMKASNLISLDEYTEAGSEVKMESAGNSHFDQPEEAIEKEELKEMMVRAIDSLTEKERSVVVLYYYEDMTLKEISLTLEVSESRVSQLHTKALNKMKKILGDYVFSL